MTAHPGHEWHTEFDQSRLHERRRLLLMQCQFRVGVQMTAPIGQGFVQSLIHQPFT